MLNWDNAHAMMLPFPLLLSTAIMKRAIFLLGIVAILVGIGYMAYVAFIDEGIAPASASATAAPSSSSLIP